MNPDPSNGYHNLGVYEHTLSNDFTRSIANGAPPLAGLPQVAEQQNGMNRADEDEETDDEMEWEEIDLSRSVPDVVLPTQNIEITLGENVEDKPKKRIGIDPIQRLIRLECHKMHTIALLASFSRRNKWANNPLLHARLLSLTPLHLQTAFTQIHKKLVPDASRRSRLFYTAIFKLTEWWFSWFRIVPHKGVRSQTFLEVEKQRLLYEKKKKKDIKGKGKAKERDDTGDDTPYSDQLRSVNSLMKHALIRSGSKDTSAILFTALCRPLDIPARLVVSLQGVPWSSKTEKLKTSDIDKLKEDEIISSSDTPSASTPSKVQGKGKDDVVKLRRSKPKDRKIRAVKPRSNSIEPPLEGWPPVVWTEVYSRSEGKWIPIDCVRYLVDKRKLFEPPEGCRVNRMFYVVGLEEDGYARDVTLRYARQFGAKTAKARASTRRGQSDWWELVMVMLTRPYRLNRDDVEDNEFRTLQYWEGMPTSVGGFKDHPIYALERHLRKDEVIHPRQEIGKFRGEPVFSRSDIQRVRTAETWMREGRIIKMGQQPLKRAAHRASTINKKRMLELAKQQQQDLEGEHGRHAEDQFPASEIGTQGLYAMWQTEIYVPDPVIDGKIPKNDFGNINLFVESMLPYGATHLPYQGIAKITKKLGIDFAPAVTGFEFRKGHANPIITGIVVASDNEDVVLSAYWESAQAANEAEAAKRYDRVIRRWTRLIQGLRLRKRLQEEYGNKESVVQPPPEDQAPSAPGGGFLTEYDGVIEHFNLPKTRIFQQIQETDSTSRTQEVQEQERPQVEDTWAPALMELEAPVDDMPTNDITGITDVQPKTLRQRAAEHYARRSEASLALTSSSPTTTPPPAPSRKRKATRRTHDSFSPEDSASDFDNVEEAPSKRTRSSRKRPSPQPPRRQLRPRVQR